jgi:hypothetical protein
MGLARECGVKIQLIQSFLAQRIRNQKWVTNQAADPPFLGWSALAISRNTMKTIKLTSNITRVNDCFPIPFD